MSFSIISFVVVVVDVDLKFVFKSVCEGDGLISVKDIPRCRFKQDFFKKSILI